MFVLKFSSNQKLFFQWPFQSFSLTMSCSMWDLSSLFPDQVLNPRPLPWKCRVLTTGPPAKSLQNHFKDLNKSCKFPSPNALSSPNINLFKSFLLKKGWLAPPVPIQCPTPSGKHICIVSFATTSLSAISVYF